MTDKYNVTCLGGGNAMPKAVFGGLKQRQVTIAAICAMLDTGGSTGRLRRDYKIRAPGDLRRALISLANTSPVLERLFNYRFEVGELEGHNFANLLILALELNSQDYMKAVDELREILNVEHEVLPVTLDNSDLYARLEDDTVVKGEANIDRPKHDHTLRIREVFLQPEAEAYSKALGAIRDTDMVVIGPGDLYSTIAQIMKVQGVTEAMKKSRGRLVYITNLMTKRGETENFSVRDFSDQIEEWLGGELDTVIYNNHWPTEERVRDYLEVHPELIQMVRVEDGLEKSKFLGADLIYDEGAIEHDTEKVSDILTYLLRK